MYRPENEHLYQEMHEHLDIVCGEISYLQNALAMIADDPLERREIMQRIVYWKCHQKLIGDALARLVTNEELDALLKAPDGGDEWEFELEE